MSTPLDRWCELSELFTKRLSEVRPEQWAASTPCEEWDVRALAEHAVAYQWGYLAALGESDGVDPDLGRDPLGAWSAVSSALRAAYARPGAMDRTFDFLTPIVPGTIREQIIVPTNDLLIHTWDIARAIGADESLPVETCEAVFAAIQPLEAVIRIPEWYGPARDSVPDSSVQIQLLRFTGRAP
jgi:uncharacterized protein (TIGR03086 family)